MSGNEIDRYALTRFADNITPFPHQGSAFANVVPDPALYIETAERVHSEQLCVKNVHAAMLISTNSGGIIEMYGRNALTHGSPAQLDGFSVSNLRHLADETTNKRIVNFLRDQRDITAIISCRQIAQQAECAWCLKEHKWQDMPILENDDDQTSHVPKPSEKYCPNNMAKACTERLFLNVWLPYVIELQRELSAAEMLLPEERLIIKQVRFDPNKDFPDIEYATGSTEAQGFNWWKDIHPATLEEQKEIIVKMLLITKYAPCKDCANDFVRHQLRDKLELHMLDLSRYAATGLPNIGLDRDDIAALNTIISAGIPMTYNGIDTVKMVWRDSMK